MPIDWRNYEGNGRQKPQPKRRKKAAPLPLGRR